MSVLAVFIGEKGKKVTLVKAMFNMILAVLLILTGAWLSLSLANIAFDFSFLGEVKGRVWQGFLMTIGLSAVSLVVSLAIGIVFGVLQTSRVLVLRYLANVYVKFIRGTPLIMQIYLFFYIVGTAFGVNNRFLSGVIILSIFEGAYIAEIIRGGLLSIEKSQLESARAVGFSKWQTATNVILPQMITQTLPALTGQFASIIKDSSLLSMIAVIELTQTMREISADNFKLFECFILLGVLYLCLTLPISFVSEWFERRYKYEN